MPNTTQQRNSLIHLILPAKQAYLQRDLTGLALFVTTPAMRVGKFQQHPGKIAALILDDSQNIFIFISHWKTILIL